jgi:hypothetical protein
MVPECHFKTVAGTHEGAQEEERERERQGPRQLAVDSPVAASRGVLRRCLLRLRPAAAYRRRRRHLLGVLLSWGGGASSVWDRLKGGEKPELSFARQGPAVCHLMCKHP